MAKAKKETKTEEATVDSETVVEPTVIAHDLTTTTASVPVNQQLHSDPQMNEWLKNYFNK